MNLQKDLKHLRFNQNYGRIITVISAVSVPLRKCNIVRKTNIILCVGYAYCEQVQQQVPYPSHSPTFCPAYTFHARTY